MKREQFENLRQKYEQDVVNASNKLTQANVKLLAFKNGVKEFGVQNLNENGCVVVVLGDLLNELARAYRVDRDQVSITGGIANIDVKNASSKSFGKINIVIMHNGCKHQIASFKVAADTEFVDGATVESVMKSKSSQSKHSILDLKLDVDVTSECVQNKLFRKAVKNVVADIHRAEKVM